MRALTELMCPSIWASSVDSELVKERYAKKRITSSTMIAITKAMRQPLPAPAQLPGCLQRRRKIDPATAPTFAPPDRPNSAPLPPAPQLHSDREAQPSPRSRCGHVGLPVANELA